MAAHGTPEYSTAAGNDYPAHEESYRSFTYMVLIGILYVIVICLGLTVGGVKNNWLVGGGLIFVGSIVAPISIATGSKIPSYVMVALGFVALALA